MALRLIGVLIFVLALLPAGCGAKPTDGVLRMGLATAPRGFDPRHATDAASERVNRLLYRRLTELDPAGRPVPSLATWETLSATAYRFTLRAEGRRFSDGSRLTAEDVVATFQSILDPASGSPHRALLALIEEVRSEGPDQVVFRLSEPDPLFPAYLAIGILPARLIAAGHPFASDPVGSGPMRLAARLEAGRVRLERLRDGQAIELVAVKDPSVRVMKLLRGEVDLVQADLAPELVDYLGRQPGIRVARAPGTNFLYLGFNLGDPHTGRPEVRQAIAYAIDRAAILRHLFRGGGRLAGGMFPPEHWAGGPSTGRSHDPDRARALLAAAGYGPGRPLVLTYKTSSDPFRVRLASVIQAQLAEVGITLKVQSYDWGTFYGDIKAGRFQLYALSWVGVRTPDIFRYAFHSASVPPQGANRGRFASGEADRLIETARAEPDLTRAADLYRVLQSLLLEDLPYVPLWYEDQVFAARAGVADYRLAPDGNYDGLLDVRFSTADRDEENAAADERQ
ncbi:MAG: ABC transporter substrate-binding protein [Chromatiaceae bacterium]|nr:ABC transporter substrate-binding protein [Chromatiaceae bacterium]